MTQKEDIYWLGLSELQKRFPDRPVADLQASVDKFRRDDKALTSSAMIPASAELENPDREIEVADSGLAWFISKEGEGEKFITEYDNPLIKEGCNVNNEVKKRTLVVNPLYTAKTSLGIQFDQSDPEGSPLEVRKGTLIEGLIITLLDMKLKENFEKLALITTGLCPTIIATLIVLLLLLLGHVIHHVGLWLLTL